MEETHTPLTGAEKHALAVTHLEGLMRDTRALLNAADALVRNPGPDPQHFYAESVRLAAETTRTATAYRERLAQTALQAPHRVSFPKVSALTGVSVNTLRSRMGHTPRPHDAGSGDPHE